MSQSGTTPLEGSPTKHWRGGIFYFNPENPRIFVPKRFGIGWTLNFARPGAWFALTGIIVLGIALHYLRNRPR